jgi:hypothetical protein
MPDPTHDSAALTASATRLRGILTALVAFLVAALVAERLGYAGLYRGIATPAGLARQMLFASPAAAYLIALWQLRHVAAAVAEGAAFGSAAVRGLRRVGLSLIAGAILALAMPALHRLLGQDYVRLIDFDVATLVIAGIGLGLVFLARLLDRAGAVQAELDEIF